MAANDNLDLILRRHQEISARLAEGASGAQYSALSRELNELEPVVAAIQAFHAKEKERADLAAMLREPDLDPDMRAMASDELAAAEAEAEAMSKAIRIALLPKDAADEGGAILEVRAGTGGDEAALFAGDLFRMYVKYAERKRWKVEILSSSEGTAGRIQGNRRRDFGPRRVRAAQVRERRPSGAARAGDRDPGAHPHLGRDRRRAADRARKRTSSSTRPISRSTPIAPPAPAASMSTRPNPRSASPTCRPASWSRCRRSGRSIATAPRRWRSCARASSTRKNQKLDAERAQERRSQVGSGDRSQRIRTYNFPQGRVTDHRINLTLYSLDRIMEGRGPRRDHRRADRRAPGGASGRAGGLVTPVPRLPSFAPGMRIGLLGGSFNPPHEGHALITRLALTRLALDRVWWLVTPGNPLKSLTGLAALKRASRPRAGSTSGRASSSATSRRRSAPASPMTRLLWLKRRAPGVRFVWIMGADNLRQFHLWRRWRLIAELTPIAVVDRPGSTLKAISSPAGAALAPLARPRARRGAVRGHEAAGAALSARAALQAFVHGAQARG